MSEQYTDNVRVQGSAAGKTKGRHGGLVALIGASAAAILVPLVQQWEGTRYVPYKDIVSVWTVCTGDTYNVELGRVYTKAECEARLERQLIAHAKPVLECVPGLKAYPNATAAAISLAYNVGPSAFCRSTAARRFNAGNIRGGCDAMLWWNRAGGRVVRGLVNRRRAEHRICIRDAG